MLYARHKTDLLRFCLLSSIFHLHVDNIYVYESKQVGFSITMATTLKTLWCTDVVCILGELYFCYFVTRYEK